MPTRTRLAVTALSAGAVAIPSAVFATTYVVRPGDSLSDIATRHGTTVSSLQEANRMSEAPLRVGQLLTIPDHRVALPAYTRQAEDLETHEVKPGEGVFDIARRYGVDATALARLSGIGVNTQLSPGVTLTIPGRLARMSALLGDVAAMLETDARLVRAVGWTESEWRQHVVSPTGAVGVMQLEPHTGDWVSRHLAGRRLDIWIARDNVTAGSMLLRHLLRVHEGDAEAALAAYYQGDASIASRGRFDDTNRYVRTVTALMQED
jgi:N-acetylmuramoyl-L-alanine amidase